MMRDPFTREQLRFERATFRPVPFEGPFTPPPERNVGDIVVAIAAIAAAILLATSEILGWPIPHP